MAKDNTNSNTYYDIHFHAFNLSHPYLNAILNRFNISKSTATSLSTILNPFVSFIAGITLFLASILTTIIFPLRSWLKSKLVKKVSRFNNLIAVMENDIGSFFLLMENCLREHGKLNNKGLLVGEKRYAKIVLTPLMMDFGYKDIKNQNIHYNRPSAKPIKEQVIDVFNAIKKYRDFEYSDEFEEKFPSLKPEDNGDSTIRLFEIYPFLGINTKNYEKEDIEKMLDKYFCEYKGSRQDLHDNMGKFDGNIDSIKSNSFAGVKVYPPLDFDPWPESCQKELDKVELLYSYCEKNGIPITAHGSEGGFVVVSKGRLKEITDIAKWDQVLGKYPKLKLNLAHFPINEKRFIFFDKTDRLEQIVNLISETRPNVYFDFSCRALDEKYYAKLKEYINNKPDRLQDELRKRILFGSDFPINLMSLDSYDEYLSVFSKSSSIHDFREQFCSINPHKFLFKAED